MAVSLQQLGDAVKVYRQARRLTQSQVAARLNPPTNRSVIAHLEQGIRLPNRTDLRNICRYLAIPDELWVPFELEAVRLRTLQELNAGTAPRGLPRLIAISGLQASGKTTLARKIASNLGYYYVSQSPLGKAYLSDLKANPRRWAYETQLTFLCYKALEISDALGRFRRIIVDRSIYEDVNVFARSFFDSGDIDERSFETYKALAHHFTEDIPPPDLVIYCDVPVTTALARIKERGREDEFLHSRKHLEAIQALYTEWLKLYKESSVWKIDSTNNDWRDENIARDICAELVDIWGQSTPTTAQLTLFDTTLAPPNLESKSRRPTRFTLLHERPRPAADAPMLSVASVTPQYPTAYIAAPFTAKAKATQKKKRELLSA